MSAIIALRVRWVSSAQIFIKTALLWNFKNQWNFVVKDVLMKY